ncbi:assimilatory sulfite reductase (NADPH) flavoprotein subunit [Brackiella oedipodis]|uniref:assimilatory sulfite reductase (NADPH) flavoprotein subunit n=1 Tax=Brackiella oedipodis TaxID=124225 RepID=UPI00048D4301|nr:assimilatory sulfite reductase (NADPH) flavoprotein subunit [Brackiella oedipodis]
MNLPFSEDFLQQIQNLSPTEMAWLSGYAWACSQQGQANMAVSQTSAAPTAGVSPQASVERRVTVFSASQTGNARRLAEQLGARLQAQGLNCEVVSASDFKSKQLPQLDIVAFTISTQGEGDPPEEAMPLFKFLKGKKKPDLSALNYAVLALGDSSYTNSYCQAGRELDELLAELGATRLMPRVDCDLDYHEPAEAWQEAVSSEFSQLCQAQSHAQGGTASFSSHATVPSGASLYTRESPFTATLLNKQKITAEGANKDIQHLEFDLEGSDIHYEAGDALGVFYENSSALVAELLAATQVDPDADVKLPNGETVSITQALVAHADITLNSPIFVKDYAALSAAAPLQAMLQDKDLLADYVENNPPAKVVLDYPVALSAQQLFDVFRPLTPRLYSIASSQQEVGDEVHVTVGVVRYELDRKTYTGGASGFLGQYLEEDGQVRVFIEENRNFRLPDNPETDIIMIGAGTGVAPFRAFMQQRAAQEASGKHWLFFGNQKFVDDFLYQLEWQQYRKDGLLHNYDFAWSRDGAEKVYVQHKMAQRSQEIWQWLQRGAHIYVCGDAKKMAKDVEQTLLQIIAKEGAMDLDDADDYLNTLREDKRYQRDVY